MLKNYLMFSTIACLLTVFAGTLLSVPVKAEEEPAWYRVTISQNPLMAFIEAQTPVINGRLYMASWGAPQFPDGWANFVRNFQVRDESNRELSFAVKPNGVWQLSNNITGTVKMSYQVDFSFAKEKWPYGNEQAAYFEDETLFTVSKALFVVSDAPGSRQISFNIPASWKLSTPWPNVNSSAFEYLAENNNDLLNNSVVFGKHREFVFTEGNFTFILALVGSVENARELIASTLQKVVRSYSRIFDKTARSKYLMTVFYSDAIDAEAFLRSAAFTERETLTKQNLIRWGNTLAHEFFHSWNGAAIAGLDYATSQWFSEGFTEYFANLALVQEGLISKELFFKKMENHLGLYLYFKEAPAFDGTTLKEAGARKGRFRLGVYNGGWSVAFCLDLLIRDATQNRKSLVNFMRSMYEKFGLTGKKYRYEDLAITAGETAGRDVSGFFKSYVEGKETLPVQEYLNRIGLNGYTQSYDGEFYIFESPTMNVKQRNLLRRILTGEPHSRRSTQPVRRSL